MKSRIFFAVPISALLIVSAAAQTPMQRVAVDTASPPQRQDAPVRVQTTINLFMPGPTGDTEEGTKLRDRARAIIYDAASRECDLLRQNLAKDCRLESLNSNINKQFGQVQLEGFSISGTMSFQITLK
jgi:hypothetical protein